MEKQFTLYSRAGCHLCEQMAADLRALVGPEVSLHLVDIDLDPDLRATFNDKVPVLMLGDVELCRYFLDAEAVKAAWQP